MNIDLLLLAAVDGLSFAGLLFLISLGLTLICGVFGVINVAHGSLYAFGGYSAASLLAWLLPHSSSTIVLVASVLFVVVYAAVSVRQRLSGRAARQEAAASRARSIAGLFD